MVTRNVRFVWPVALISMGLIGLCSVMAAFLLRQQSDIAAILGENIRSRRAAGDLEESLIDLIGLLKDRVEGVATLHQRIETHLARISQLADHDEELLLARRLTASFESYLALWRQVPPPPGAAHEQAVHEAATLLESDTLRRCQELREHNHRRIEEVAENHRRELRELAWGMAGVGSTGGVAGLLLGYLVARGLEHSIRRLQVHIKDAAGKLGGAAPEIVLTSEGDLDQLQGQMQGLVRQIEEVVARLQQREAEVRRAEHLAAVGQLAAGVAHEVRNPLTSIKMLVQAGREECPAGLPGEDLEVIEREVRRMEKSLHTFLTFTRPARPERKRQDLAELIGRTLELIGGRADRQQVRLELELPHEAMPAFVDGEQLGQVLVNLCLNALDAMPMGGRLGLVLRAVTPELAEVQVLDSGPGIAPEVMARLFEPFVSTKETGLGLGLVISRRIVEDHGGSLKAENRHGGGARLTVRIPLAAGGGCCVPPVAH